MLQWETDVAELQRAIVDGASATLQRHGLDGYRELWAAEFPAEELAALKAQQPGGWTPGCPDEDRAWVDSYGDVTEVSANSLIKPLAVELAPIRVNAISPGFADTPWWRALPDADRLAYFDSAARALPARQIATADDIAEAIVLAASNPNITGTVIETDGGARLVSLG